MEQQSMRKALYKRTLAESDPLVQYGCGPVQFSGADNTFYERRLIFDKLIEPAAASLRDQFEVFASSIRDVLSQRWVLTTRTYAERNPKRTCGQAAG
jgi:starch phosphorylase